MTANGAQLQASSQTRPITGLAIGVDTPTMTHVREILRQVDFKEVAMNVDKLLQAKVEPPPDFILCGPLYEGMELVDVAQGVRSVYSDSPMYYISSDRSTFDQESLTKNGFTDAFLLPIDKYLLSNLAPESQRNFKRVPLIDISPNTTLDFDTYIYLPVNQKFVRYCSSGYPLEAGRAKRLIDREITIVHVPKDQMEAFYQFSAGQLKKISSDLGVSETERREKMHIAIRSLFNGLLRDHSTLEDYAGIIKNYILDKGNDQSVLYEKLLKYTSGNSDAYSHVANVSALASLFAMALGLDKIEDIALAALLHDIGLADVTLTIQGKSQAERTAEEQQAYEAHPATAIAIIKSRQLDISEKIYKIIEQHHERWDGTGYPAKLKGGAILTESQILALADEFEYQMQNRPGRARRSARTVLEDLFSNPAFSPEICASLAQVFGLHSKAQ